MSKDLLLEIGTEEIPAHFMPGILQQLKDHVQSLNMEQQPLVNKLEPNLVG